MSAALPPPETASVGLALPSDGNPFPGLRPFREEEESLFFGRECQVDAMVDKLAKHRFLAVTGTSGSGKSSLVNCGLRPALHRGLMTAAGPAWRVVQFRPGAEPLKALARALAAEGVLYTGYQSPIPLEEILETHLRRSSRGILEVVQKARLPERSNLLVVADQFEELFRYRALRKSATGAPGTADDATALVNLLLEAAAEPDARIYVVLTMRSDFLGDCSLFHGLPEAINEGQYLVPRLTRDERRAAIAGPAAVAGAEIDPVLLTRLVNDVGDNPDQLSILQHALNRTWAHWARAGGGVRSIALEHYEAIGTMAAALDAHAEKAYAELPEGRPRAICEKIFRALTDKATDARGTRRPTRLASLCLLAGATAAEVTDVINVFRKPSRSFLMPPRADRLDPDTVVDISHESLMRVWERLKRWTDQEARSARMYRRLADTAALHADGKAGLWRDPDLGLALEWRGTEQPTEAWAELYEGGLAAVTDFLDQSKERRDRESAEIEVERRWRSSWAVGIVAVNLALFLWGFHELFGRLVDAPTGDFWPRLLRWAKALGVITLIGTPCLLSFLGMTFFGKRAYRRYAFPKVLAQIGAAPVNLPAPIEREKVEAVIARHTSYAGLGRRLVAGLLDGAIFGVLLFIPIVVVGVFQGLFPGLSGEGDIGDTTVAITLVVGLALDWLYQAGTISSKRQATLGMRAVGIFVTDLYGDRLSFARATLRHLTKPVAYGTLLIGKLMQPFMKRKQALHDLIAHAVVLRKPAPGPEGNAPTAVTRG